MYKVLQGTPTMETSPLQCRPLPSTTTAQWSLLHTHLSGATRGTPPPAGSRGFSGHLRGEKEVGKEMTKGGLSVMSFWRKVLMMIFRIRRLQGGVRLWLLCSVLCYCSLLFAWLYGELAGLSRRRLPWRYANKFKFSSDKQIWSMKMVEFHSSNYILMMLNVMSC